MMNALSKVKEEYNRLLGRYNKAEVYFSDPDVSEAEKNTFIPNYEKLIISMSRLMNEYQKITGEDMTEEQACNGFDI